MKIPKQSPLKQIRKQCLECHCESTKSARFCHSMECPLWYFRMGKYPRTYIRENGKETEQLFNPENFKKGAKFSPDQLNETYRLKK